MTGETGPSLLSDTRMVSDRTASTVEPPRRRSRETGIQRAPPCGASVDGGFCQRNSQMECAHMVEADSGIGRRIQAGPGPCGSAQAGDRRHPASR